MTLGLQLKTFELYKQPVTQIYAWFLLWMPFHAPDICMWCIRGRFPRVLMDDDSSGYWKRCLDYKYMVDTPHEKTIKLFEKKKWVSHYTIFSSWFFLSVLYIRTITKFRQAVCSQVSRYHSRNVTPNGDGTSASAASSELVVIYSQRWIFIEKNQLCETSAVAYITIDPFDSLHFQHDHRKERKTSNR